MVITVRGLGAIFIRIADGVAFNISFHTQGNFLIKPCMQSKDFAMKRRNVKNFFIKIHKTIILQ